MTSEAATAEARAGAEPEYGRALGVFFIVLGVITIGAGILAMVYPDVTLLVVSLLAGGALIVFSSLDLVEALTGSDEALDAAHRVLSAAVAVLGLVLGIVVIRHPFNSIAVLILALGIYLTVAGVVGTVKAFRALTSDRAARMFASVAMVVFGLLILALPGLSLRTLALFAGFGLIARGVIAIFVGLVAIKTARLAEQLRQS